MVGLKNGHIHKNLTPNGESQRSSWGMQSKKKKKGFSTWHFPKLVVGFLLHSRFLTAIAMPISNALFELGAPVRLFVLTDWATQSGRATEIRLTRTDENGCMRPFIATSAKTTKAVGGGGGGGGGGGTSVLIRLSKECCCLLFT